MPVIGFLVNGIAFTTGEAEVDNAFESVQAAGTLEDASRDFKDALNRMRTAPAISHVSRDRPISRPSMTAASLRCAVSIASRRIPRKTRSASCRICAL